MTKGKNDFGKLFYHADFSDDSILLREIIAELAELMGHTTQKPISMGLLCLHYMMPYRIALDICLEITQLLNKIAEKNGKKEIKLAQIKKIIISNFPNAEAFTDADFLTFWDTMQRLWLPDFQNLFYSHIDKMP